MIALEKLRIVKVIRDESGNIIGYELNPGSIIDNEQAVYMAKNNEISNVIIRQDASGREKLYGIGFDIEKLSELY